MTIPYQPKVNARPVGLEQLINNEAHVIGITGVATASPNTVRLIEVPVHDAPSTVIIPGYTEIPTGSPSSSQFLVNYANGRILFNSSQSGFTVFVTYKGRGSEVDAEDVNELQGPLGSIANINGTLTAGIVRPNTISNDPADNFVFPNNITANGSIFARKLADFLGIAAPAVSPANHGTIYYDLASQAFQISENGGAYTPLGSNNFGSQYQLAYYAANGRVLSGLTLIVANRAIVSDSNGLPTGSVTTATEIGYVSGVTSPIQTQFTGKLSRDGSLPMTGNLDMGSFQIKNMVDPTLSQDGATKHYVDSVAQGITWKQVVRLATAAVLPFSPNYFNGVSGVGATLTATSNGALSVDGTAVALSDRILVKNQVAALQNGIYDVTNPGSAGTPYILTRSVDANLPTEIQAGSAVFVSAGSTNIELGFIQIAIVSTIGTDPITFTQFTGAAYITTTFPLAKSGNTIFITPLGIDNSLISTTAAIDYSKLATLGQYATVVTDTFGHITTGQVSAGEFYQRIFFTPIVALNGATDVTTQQPFVVTAVSDLTHLIVGSTAGMSFGDTITQNNNVTTITTVTDATHLVVGSTFGWVVTSGDIPTHATLTLQSLTYTAVATGISGNSISVQYTAGGIAGSEFVSVLGNAITVQIQSGVSTATQVQAAINGSAPALALISVQITGFAATAQTAPTAIFFLANGLNGPVEGSTWYNPVTHQFMGYNGTNNVIIG